MPKRIWTRFYEEFLFFGLAVRVEVFISISVWSNLVVYVVVVVVRAEVAFLVAITYLFGGCDDDDIMPFNL